MTKKSFLDKSGNAKANLWKHERPFLKGIDIELTERCNNNCSHCYINKPVADNTLRSQELTTEQWKSLIREAADLGALDLRITGGEPLVRHDFSELYTFARRLGLRVTLLTNGCLLTDSVAQLFATIPPLQKVEITVYGMSRESYERATRNPGSYKQLKNGIRLLQSYNIPHIFKGSFFRSDAKEIIEFEKLCSDNPWMKEPPNFAMFFQLRSRRDSAEKNRMISSLRIPPKEGVELQIKDKEDFIREKYQQFRSLFIFPTDKIFACGTGNTLTIDAYGKIQFCLGLRHPQFVLDSKENSLRVFLSDFLPKLYKTTAENDQYLQRCARCFIRSLCDQCPAKSWSEYGSLDHPVEYFCEIAHEQAYYIGLLGDGEKSWEVENWRQRLDEWLEKIDPKYNKG